MAYTKTTPELIDRVRRTVAAFQGQLPMSELCRLVPDVERGTMERVCKMLGISLPRGPQFLRQTKEKACIRLWSIGWSHEKIRNALGIAPMTLTTALRSVPRSDRISRAAKKRRKVSDDKVDDILGTLSMAPIRSRGSMQRVLAEEHGVTQRAIREVWNRRPETINPRGAKLFTDEEREQLYEQVRKFPQSEMTSVIHDLVDDLNDERPGLVPPIDAYDVRLAIRQHMNTRSAARADA